MTPRLGRDLSTAADRPRLAAGWRILLTIGALFMFVFGGFVVAEPLRLIPGLSEVVIRLVGIGGQAAIGVLLAYALRRFVDRGDWSGVGLVIGRAVLPHLVVGTVLAAATVWTTYGLAALIGIIPLPWLGEVPTQGGLGELALAYVVVFAGPR